MEGVLGTLRIIAPTIAYLKPVAEIETGQLNLPRIKACGVRSLCCLIARHLSTSNADNLSTSCTPMTHAVTFQLLHSKLMDPNMSHQKKELTNGGRHK
jgi:hypothetical protein